MAQIIKHRRGSIDAVKGSTARKGELIMATGSVDTTLQGPFLFIGSDDGTGLYSPASKLYAGTSAPNIAAATYGSSLDGTPFYATSEKSLYILQNSNVGNTKIDLTGNLEGNTVSGMTINNLTGTTATFDTINLSTIAFTGLTEGRVTLVGPDGSLVDSGSLNFNNSELGISGSIKLNDSAYIYNDGALFVEDNTNGVTIQSNNYAELQSSNAWVWVEGNDAYVEGGNYTKISTNSGNVDIFSYNGGTLNLNNDGGEGDVNIGNGNNYVSINATTYVNMIYDYTAHSNYLQLYGLGTDDGFWWESGNGDDTTLINNRNGSNLNILQENAGNVNISARQGSVNLSSDNGFNVTGSVNISGDTSVSGSFHVFGSDVHLTGSNTVELTYDGQAGFISDITKTEVFSYHSDLTLISYNNNVNISTDGNTGSTINLHNNTTLTGSFNVTGNTSLTGALVVSNGSATFDQGLVAQNSNMLLTSGSNLIVQNNGNVTVDYIQGNTQQWNYLALNGGALGAPNVELSSTGDISLFAEGGTVNVTGSLKVTGDIVFSGSINLGDFTGDTINFNGEVNSNVLPTTGNTFSLGASGQTWSDVWAENAHFTNISLNTISFDGLTQDRVVFVGENGSLVDNGNFTFVYDGDLDDNVLSAPIIHASNDGNGTNFLIGNDMWLGDVNVANATRFMGNEDNNIAKIYLGSNSLNDYLESNYSDVTLKSSNNLNLKSQNSHVYLDAYNGNIYLSDDTGNNIYVNGDTYFQNYHTLYINEIYGNSGEYLDIAADGNIWINTYSNHAWFEVNEGDSGLYVANNDTTELWSNTNDVNVQSYNNYVYLQGTQTYIESTNGTLYLNDNSGNNININGNTYFNTNKTMYVSNMVDNNDGVNYLQLYGWNTNDGYWWEGGDGRDTTLYADENANLNILNRSGKINIDSTNGSVNLHTANGFNVTGSMVVSDASGVFNSSLIAYNSDLTLDGGSNIQMNNGAHLYFNDGCADMYFDAGTGDLRFYNDCGHIRFDTRFNTNQHMYIENNRYLYTNNVYGYDGGDLNLGAQGGVYIFSESNHYVEISSPNAESGTNYLKVQESGISLETYDYTSGLTHKVLLDNTGSLNFENVQIGITGSLDVSGSLDVYGQTHIHNDLYVSGNLTILGSGTTVFISSSQVDIGTNIINLNTYAPFERFAGITVYDSGSNAGVTGSLLWDSTNNVWIYANPSGSNYASARFISGPQNTGSLGNETGLTNGHFPVATGDDHISDSLLTYQGTTLALNSNKFTVDSDSGDTLIHGNFTIEGVGATDNGTYSSYIVFRNDENVLGFVDTTDTHNVTDRLLGYNESTGVLEFSSLIDGGTY